MLGAIATVLAVTINHHIRKGKSKIEEKERPGVANVNNAGLEIEMDAVQNIPTVHCTNEGKYGNLLPFAHSVKLSRKRNAQEAKTRSMTKKEENGDIYNHLHEKENDPDIDEINYDHAPENLCNAMGESNYSNL
ncbi:uncharacterized protein LOC133187084 [Saccostrea echinata]|uniref:uncharacterized protein LOC133187084 n=1 Tax=Saccostrea echinata TaxID=191078 RepID=UPI002A7FE08F|nr:uncharacterized protein LOC133187084 [Saccostrea echinata]